MSPEARREQLLDLGARLFAAQPYEDVRIDEVAVQAGVSRGLLYHYFPTKRAYFVAILNREVAQMMDLTSTDGEASIADQLHNGIDAYLRYCKKRAHGVRMINSGAGSADPDIQEIVARDRNEREDQILDALSPGTPAHPLARIAVRSWLEFMRTACLSWLDTPEVARDEIRAMCADALLTTILSLPEHARPPELPE